MSEIRALGYCEARMHAMHRELHGTTQALAAARVQGPLHTATFLSALSQVRELYPFLRVQIQERPEGPWFCAALEPELPVEIFAEAGDEAWLDVLQHYASTPLDLTRGLWRIVLVLGPRSPLEAQRFDLVLVAHHALLDAVGAARILEAVLVEMAGRRARQPNGRSIPGSLEQLSGARLGWDAFEAHQASLAAKWERPSTTAHPRVIPLEQRTTRVLPFTIDAGMLARVQLKCTALRISVNSFFSSCLLHAVQRQTPERTSFALYSAISRRRACGAHIQDWELGCYLSVAPAFVDVPTLEGDVAARLALTAREHQRSLLANAADAAQHPYEVRYEKLRSAVCAMRDVNRFVNDIAFTFAETDWSCDLAPYTVEHVYVSANRAAGLSSVVLHGLVLGGVVHFTLNLTLPLESCTRARRIRDDFLELVHVGAGLNYKH